MGIQDMHRSSDRRISLALGIVLGVLTIAFALRPEPPVDLAVYLRAGQRFFGGGGLYGPSWGAPLDHPLPYTYPPLWAAVGSAVSWLPWRVVAGAWFLLNVALLVWIVRMSFERFLATRGADRPRWLAILLLIATISAPIAATLWLGQVGIALTAAILADTVPRRTRLPRGVLVGAATAVKLTPGVFVVYWAVTGRLREATRAIGTALGLWLVVAALRPAPSWTFWTSVVFDSSRIGNLADIVNQSLRGMLLHVGWSAQAPWLGLAVAIACVGLWRARRAHALGNELAAVTLVGLTGLAISPVSWIHHAVWIVPAVGVVLGAGERAGRVRVAVAVAVLYVLRLPDWANDLSLHGAFGFLVGNAYVLGYLALIAWLPIDRPVRRRQTVASASWPHAASIERPRVSRTVTFAPARSSVATNRATRAGGEPSTA
jgi:alpha-1,2-mannosyltransferase